MAQVRKNLDFTCLANTRTKKKVSFKDHDVESSQEGIFMTSSLTIEDRKSMSYSPYELKELKNEAKILVQKIHRIRRLKRTELIEKKSSSQLNGNNSQKLHDATDVSDKKDKSFAVAVPLFIPKPELEKDICTRGLEFDMSNERRRNKLIAIRAILELQNELRQKSLHGTYHAAMLLRRLSYKCSRMARNIAILTGHLDFQEAYGIKDDRRDQRAKVNRELPSFKFNLE